METGIIKQKQTMRNNVVFKYQNRNMQVMKNTSNKARFLKKSQLVINMTEIIFYL